MLFVLFGDYTSLSKMSLDTLDGMEVRIFDQLVLRV